MARLGREDWIAAAVEALLEDGVEGVAFEPLPRTLGVTKGSFYWHFERRAELLEELLARWERQGTQAVIDAVDAAADDPRERLRALGRLTFSDRATTADRLEPVLRSWATTDEGVAAVVVRVDGARLRYVTDLLVAAGVTPEAAERRAQIIYRTLIGEWLYRSTGGDGLSRAAVDELLDLALAVTAPPSDREPPP